MLPPGFVNESAAGMKSLTAELLRDAAQRRERNNLAQSSASRALRPWLACVLFFFFI